MKIYLIALFALGCAPPKVLSPLDVDVIPWCKTGPPIVTQDSCAGMFARDGLPCVVCHTEGGCIHPDAIVYCARTGCALDGECRMDPEFRPVLR